MARWLKRGIDAADTRRLDTQVRDGERWSKSAAQDGVARSIPQTRGYRDENGRPFYPQSLERGVRSGRAMTLAVAEMYVQGVSSRKVVTRQPPWASRTQGDQAPPRPIQAAEKATA
jgi:hypothetical protein